MGIIAWIILGLGAGLLANMLIPGKRQQGLIITCLIGIAGALGGGWAATKCSTSTPCTGSQRLHLAHRHRRRSRPAARLPPDRRAVRRVRAGTVLVARNEQDHRARPARGPAGQPAPARGRDAHRHRHLPPHCRRHLGVRPQIRVSALAQPADRRRHPDPRGRLGLLLPRLARSRPDHDWLRRWVPPGSPKTSASRSSPRTRAQRSAGEPPDTAPRR